MMVCMILCYLYFIPSKKYPNEQYNIENFGVLMCPLSILIFFFFFFLGPFGIPLGRLAHLIKNSPKFLITGKNQFTGIVPKHIKKKETSRNWDPSSGIGYYNTRYLVLISYQNLECIIAGRILGYFSQSPTFFVREILDGIAAQPVYMLNDFWVTCIYSLLD